MRILLTGACNWEEFTEAVNEIKRTAELVEYPCPIAAAESLRSSEAPVDLIVVAQARPGEISAGAIDALRRAAPLAPMVALLGSWCEGEMRSGSPWPGVPRVYWHQWPSRFSQEFARLRQGKLSAWSQPLTATAEDRLLSKSNGDRAPRPGVVAIVSDHREMADWLASACRQVGLSPIVLRQCPISKVDGIDVVVWDAGLPMAGLADAFRNLSAYFVGSSVLVLLDFPRVDDVHQLTSAGAAAVLAKPIGVTDLLWHIGRLV